MNTNTLLKTAVSSIISQKKKTTSATKSTGRFPPVKKTIRITRKMV